MPVSMARWLAVFQAPKVTGSCPPAVLAVPQGLLRIRRRQVALAVAQFLIGGMNGVNVAHCWLLPQGTGAVEMTLEVTNATKVRCAIPDCSLYR